jgi:SpoVK/Ycf46/Vps4 family AAA+-type ATPase
LQYEISKDGRFKTGRKNNTLLSKVVIQMTFNIKEILKFLFPEWQVVETIKEQGFIVKPNKYSKQSRVSNNDHRVAGGYAAEPSNPRVNIPSEKTFGSKSFNPHSNITKKQGAELHEIFNWIRAELGRLIIGQKNYLDSLCTAFKRPCVTGADLIKPRNVMLALGNRGTGKHSSIALIADLLRQKKLLSSSAVSRIDLSLYENSSDFSLFLSDLYKGLYEQSDIIVFDNFEKCHSSAITVIEDLSTTGRYILGSRYVFQNNSLVEATGMLLQNSISEINSNGKYFIFLSEKSERTFLEVFGTKFMDSIGDILHTEQFSPEELRKLAVKIMEKLKRRCSENLSINLDYDKSIVEMAVLNYKKATGANSIEHFVNEKMYNPLAEYKLQKLMTENENVFLFAANGKLTAQIDEERVSLAELVSNRKNISEASLEEVKRELQDVIGLEEVKQYVLSLEDNLKIQKLREEAGFKAATISMHMIFTGNPGTGKTTIARIVAKYLKAIGVLSEGQLREVSRTDLVGQYVGHTAKQTSEVIKSAIGGVLFIDEAYALSRDKHDPFGQEAIDALVKGIEDNRDNLVVILAGYKDEMKEFLKTNPGLKSRFPNIIDFKDYTPEEMYEISLVTAKSKGYRISEDCREPLARLYDKRQVKGKSDSGNGRLVRNIIEAAILNHSKRLLSGDKVEMDLLKYENFKFEEEGSFDLEAELSKIIGLQEVKNYIRSLSARLRLQKERKRLGLLTDTAQTLHMIFKGNPGTGKTMVARTVAQVLYHIGVIKTNKLVETDRAGLVAGYVGQTAIKTREKVMEAMDGVLFIDEAYALSQGGGSDFGKEAIDTLVKLMDDYRDRIVIILAGYSEDMEHFLSVNPGLKSRFPNIIEFPDYSVEELMQISEMFFKNKGYELKEEAKSKLQAILAEAKLDPQFGNGRYVRNLFERALNNQAMRLSADTDLTREELVTITAEDIERV